MSTKIIFISSDVKQKEITTLQIANTSSNLRSSKKQQPDEQNIQL